MVCAIILIRSCAARDSEEGAIMISYLLKRLIWLPLFCGRLAA